MLEYLACDLSSIHPSPHPLYNAIHMETGVISGHLDGVCDDPDDL